jgi:imidazolonepropionase
MTEGAGRGEGAEGFLLVKGARVVTPLPPPPTEVALAPRLPFLRGKAQDGAIEGADGLDVLMQGGVIVATGKDLHPGGSAVRVLEAEGRVLLPGFVDAHTHACWAGARLHEWEHRLRGASYVELLAAGGGILSTVRAVRGASEEELAGSLEGRLDRALHHGTTTLEVKSGYGLRGEAELRMLRAIRGAGERWVGTVVPTALLGHAVEPDHPGGAAGFFQEVIEEHLSAVTSAFPGVAVDAYCEEGAWPVEACIALFEAARATGHPIRVHADQFNDLGMTARAVALGARSVDHLEASTTETLAHLAGSGAAGVLLPVSGFHLDDRFADGRFLLDQGGAVVVATNWNPGSAPSPSIPFALGLAVRKNRLTPNEALVAATWNAAVLLGLPDRGWIGPGARADLVLLHHQDEREVMHTVGENPVFRVIARGRVR